MSEPVDESGDARLRDETHPGAFISGQFPKPWQLVIHPGRGGGGKGATCALESARGLVAMVSLVLRQGHPMINRGSAESGGIQAGHGTDDPSDHKGHSRGKDADE